jgi:hypothetical protein
MAFKVSSSRIIKLTQLLVRADKAMNVLERNGKNKIIYPELKKEIQDEIEEVKSMYGLEDFDEWKDLKKKHGL